MRPIVGIGKRYCNHRYMETIFRFIKHCDDCEKWPKDHWKKKKYYFQAATTMSKLMKAPKLSAWSMINAVGSPLTSLLLLLPLDISRGSHPCKHTALPPPARRSRQHERAGKRRAPMQKIQLGTGKSSINSVANTFPNHQLHYLNAPRNIWFRNAIRRYEFVTNVCLIKIRSKHSSNTLLHLLRIFMRQTLFMNTMMAFTRNAKKNISL